MDRPYQFYDVTISICSTCYRRVEAKTILQDGAAYLVKRCPEHGAQKVLIAEDADYYRKGRELGVKASEMPLKFQTPVKWGCPYDCGLCADHEQHSCLSLIEVTDQCNLRCPICYADSGPDKPGFRTLAEIEAMMDAVVASEGEPDVVQISGGEPTIHPDFWAILDAAKARPIGHLMLNTNGVKIAENPDFAARLATYAPGFEVYLQFDSLRPTVLEDLRGGDISDVRRRALDHLDAHNVSTTLVVTVKKGLNDDELGDIIEFALSRPCVRGVTFQPVQHAGRADGFDPGLHRLTLSGVRSRILQQSSRFAPEDIMPVPCHPDCIAMAYALKLDGETMPLSSLVDPAALLANAGNTIVFEKDDNVRDHVTELFRTSTGPDAADTRLRDLLCCLPKIEAGALGYDNLFRIIIMDFIDAHSFDLRAVKRTCVHIVHPDGRLIPFDTYNLFYRGDLEETRLGPLRELAL